MENANVMKNIIIIAANQNAFRAIHLAQHAMEELQITVYHVME
jgi:hypothetical protein